MGDLEMGAGDKKTKRRRRRKRESRKETLKEKAVKGKKVRTSIIFCVIEQSGRGYKEEGRKAANSSIYNWNNKS